MHPNNRFLHPYRLIVEVIRESIRESIIMGTLVSWMKTTNVVARRSSSGDGLQS